MKKVFSCLVASVLACFFVATYAGEKKKDAEKYDQWLKEEVKLLVTQDEEDQFKKLKSNEERDQFIELFWAKRDPSPGTKENEFKDEWYRRLEYVTKSYNTGPLKGWHSDMGRVYMFFGPPLQTSGLAPQTRSETMMGGSQIAGPSQVWTYQPMPDLGLNESFRVQFTEYQSVYNLGQETTQNVRRALDLFPKKVIFNPDLVELPRYKFYFDASSWEGKLIQDFMATGEEVRQISLEWKPILTRALNKSTYVSFLIQIDPQQADKKKFKEVTVFGKIKGEDEEDFLKSVNTESGSDGKLLAIAGLPTNPGQFTLYLGVRDKDKEKYTLLKSDLEVQNLWNDELSTSSLILSPDVTEASGSDSEGEFNPYVVGQYKAAPRWGNVFKPSEFLNVLFQVYNATLENEKVSLAIDYFIISPQVSYKLSPQEINEKIDPEKALAGGTQIPLSPLKPGSYTLKIKITDKIANKTIEKNADFTVQ